MKMQAGKFHRDANNRLCFEIHDADSLQYPELAATVASEFNLTPVGDLIMGLDQMFRDYTDGDLCIGLDWDNWSGFIVVAKTPESEPLIESIGTSLTNS